MFCLNADWPMIGYASIPGEGMDSGESQPIHTSGQGRESVALPRTLDVLR